MANNLYWIDGPWPGKLAIAPRPRGGDWLDDDIAAWKLAGINQVLSLLTHQEEKDLDLQNESTAVKRHDLAFTSFPIEDRNVPSSETKLARSLEKLEADLSSGKNVLIHCRQGIGRAGLVAACLLIAKGIEPETALQRISTVRGATVPETAAQRKWIDHFAEVFTGK